MLSSTHQRDTTQRSSICRIHQHQTLAGFFSWPSPNLRCLRAMLAIAALEMVYSHMYLHSALIGTAKHINAHICTLEHISICN
jgi:hypothetical protein